MLHQEVFACASHNDDQMVTYYDSSNLNHKNFAVVLTNSEPEKISVLLDKHDAQRLHDQLTKFLAIKG